MTVQILVKLVMKINLSKLIKRDQKDVGEKQKKKKMMIMKVIYFQAKKELYIEIDYLFVTNIYHTHNT